MCEDHCSHHKGDRTTAGIVSSSITSLNIPPSICVRSCLCQPIRSLLMFPMLPDSLIRDGSFENVPSSALDTYSTTGGVWYAGGSAKFEAGADDFSTPYGSQ